VSWAAEFGNIFRGKLWALLITALTFKGDTCVCIQEALNQICEYSEAGITVRGTYYPPNKEPKEGDRKLYLGIEATNELAIQKAKTEIIRLIKEELQRLVRYLKYHSLTPTVAIWVQLAIKHPVPDRVKPSFVIFDIWTL